MLKLFRRIPAIFSLQSSKLQSIQVVISECGANLGKDNNEVKYSNTQFDELVFEFEARDKKINKLFSDFETSNKNLFDAYSISLKPNSLNLSCNSLILKLVKQDIW